MKEEYEDEIYRPGEELPDNLTEDEMTERRAEITRMFAEASENGRSDYYEEDDD